MWIPIVLTSLFDLAQWLADIKRFIHDAATDLPPMVKVALIHAQFETIHPFLDGKGRIGRLLITALFEDWEVLTEPSLYVGASPLNTFASNGVPLSHRYSCREGVSKSL
jgi:Fic family protein